MLNVKNTEELKSAIDFLIQEQLVQEQEIRDQFYVTVESIQPTNIIKRAFNEFITTDNVKEKIINGVLSLASGYVSKKLFVGTSNSTIKHFLGGGLQIFISKLVSDNPEKLNSITERVTNFISQWRNRGEHQETFDESTIYDNN